MVGADGTANAADVFDVIAGTDKLGATGGEQITELGVRSVIDRPVPFHSQQFAVFISSQFELEPERRTFAGVGLLLIPVVAEETGPAGGDGSRCNQCFQCWTEFVAESRTGRILDDDQFVRFKAESRGDHVEMEVDADRLGVDHYPVLTVNIGKADIRFDRHVRLALQVVFTFNHMGGALHDRCSFFTLFHVQLIVNVGGAGMDLDGIVRHGGRSVHVGGQYFQIDLDHLCCSIGVFLGVGTDDGNGITELKNLFIVEDRAIPAITLVGREGDQAGDAVFTFDILVGNDLEYAGHFFRLGGVDPLDDGMGNFRLDQGALQRPFGKLQPHIRTEIPGAGCLGYCSRPRVGGTIHSAVGRHFVFQI